MNDEIPISQLPAGQASRRRRLAEWLALALLVGILSALVAWDVRTNFSETTARRRVAATRPGDRPFNLLLETQAFTGPYVGFDRRLSSQVRALRDILQRADARESLLELSQKATAPGRLFALCGLYLVDRKLYRERAAHLASLRLSVPYVFGDERGTIEVTQVLKEIESGELPAQFALEGMKAGAAPPADKTAQE